MPNFVGRKIAVFLILFLSLIVVLGILLSFNLTQTPTDTPADRHFTLQELTQTYDLSTAGSLSNLHLISVITTSTSYQVQTAILSPAVPTSIQTASPRFSVSAYVQISVNGVLPQDQLCITLHPSDFWEPGDEAGTLRNRLGLVSEIKIDGIRIPSNARTIGGSDDLMPVFNTEQGLLGSYSGWVEICFSTADFELGLHYGTIQVITNSQRIFEYSWEFTIQAAGS